MPTTPVPSVDSGATAALAGGIGNEFSDLQSKYGLLFNPITHSFSQDPNFMSPAQKVAFQQAQLELQAKTDPATAARLASVAAAGQNAGVTSSLIPGTELSNYRGADGSIPGYGTTYGQLGGNYTNQSVASNEALTKLKAQLQQVQDAHQAFSQASGGIGGSVLEGAIHKILGNAGIGAGATYNNLMGQLGGQSSGLPALGTNSDSANSVFQSKIAQLAQQIAGYAGSPQPAYSGATGASPMQPSAPSNPYTSTAFNVANPNQSGANSFLASQGR